MSLESFSIPEFRPSTYSNLQQEILLDKDRKYIVRVLATILMSYVSRPTLGDCAVAAKALVAKHPHLGDTGSKPHVSVICLITYYIYI